MSGMHVIPDAVRPVEDPPPVVDSQRPWGHFEQLAINQCVTVKVITVSPGSRLSLQRHAHRDELWQVLDAPLTVQVGRRSWVAGAGERIWVPRGQLHRLGNDGAVPRRVVEVAFGAFDEDDIERTEDDYARAAERFCVPVPREV